MSKTQISSANAEELRACFCRLLNILGPYYLMLLVQALEGVKESTGYGAVEIILAEKAIQTIKEVKSYK